MWAFSRLTVAFLVLLVPAGLKAAETEVRTRTLETDRPWQGTLSPGELHAWRIAMGAGQHAAVEIVTASPGVHIRLLDKTGREVLSRNLSPGPRADVISWVSTGRGSWTVEVTPLPVPSPSPSDYAIWMPVPRTATARDREEWELDLLRAELERSLGDGNRETALEILRRLLAAKRRTMADDPVGLASDLEMLGDLFAAFCDGPTAADLITQALALRETAQGLDHLDVAASLSLLADMHFFLGQWDAVETTKRRALDIRLRHFAVGPQAESYRDLGSLYYSEGRFGEAIEAFKRALELFERERPPSRADIADTRNFLAAVHLERGDLREAQAGFERAADEARSELEHAPQVYARVLSNRSFLKRHQGRYAEAKSDLRQALELLSRNESYPADLAGVTLNLADLERSQQNYEEATEGFRQAQELAKQGLCPDHPDLFYFLNQYALSLAEQGRHEEAEPLFRQTVRLAKTAFGPDHPMFAQSLYDQARTLSALGRHSEADAAFRQALELREKTFGVDHPEVAVSKVQRARLILASTGKASDDALSAVEQASQVLESTRIYPEQAIKARGLQADLLRLRGDAAGARQALAGALQLIETQRLRVGGGEETRSRFLRLYVPFFQRMVDWQIEAGDLAAALEYTERYRARVLQDQLAASGLDLFGGTAGSRLDALERRLAEAQSRIAELHKQLDFTRSRSDTQQDRGVRIRSLEASLDAAYRDYESLDEEARNESPRWRSVKHSTVRLTDIRSLVPKDGFLLVYQIGDERSHLFLVPPAPDPPEVYPLEVPAEAAAFLGIPPGPLTTAGARKLVSFEDSSSPTGAAQRRHQMWRVLVPVGLWERLRPAAEIVLLPDRGLHNLPFEQLVVKPGTGPGGELYWLDDGPPIRYAPSAGALHTLAERMDATDDSDAPPVLTVADPVYDPADLDTLPAAPLQSGDPPRPAEERPLDRLPRTADESRAILRVFQEVYGEEGDDVKVLLRQQATETAVRSALPGRSFIHLGTHGFVDPQSELFAGLALTPPGPGTWPAENDGRLQLFEIYDLRLAARLVVLSACDTHVGHEVEGEGVLTLARGFLAAGARRVVASLWQVEENSTAALMESFFRRVLSDYRAGRPIRYSEALRDAKREIRAQPEWSDPFFWAPFVLTGIE